jgi:peptide/nickel transport system substrate-binding protein
MRAVLAATRRAWQGRGARSRPALGAGCAALGLAALLAACGPASGSSAIGTTPTNGGTVTYAMPPSNNVTSIFPFDDGNNFTVANLDDFQYLLYRPLYWFGTGSEPYLNPQLSLATVPVYSGQKVTISLKTNYYWSNGEPVDAQDVIFWLNMMKAEAATNWGGFIPGGIPANITNLQATGKYVVTMDIKGKYSEDWFTDNELSQITPMPLAWDVTAAGKSDCVKVVADCVAVYNYLNKLATNTADYGTSRIWAVVDGPWKVKSLNSQSYLTLVINKKYSGKLPANHIDEFIEEPFTSEQAEYNVLQDPSGAQHIDVGYLPTVDAPAAPAVGSVGSNPPSLTGYKLSVLYPWQLSYFPYNFANKTVQGAIIRQLYFRQAFQSLVDQEGVIEGPMHGYGKPTIGPVGDYPVTSYLSPLLQRLGDQWELSPAHAQTLLRANGWTPTASGTDVCTHPGVAAGDCGAGIKSGTPLKFTLLYATGIDWMESAVKELVSNASLVGMNITAIGEPFGNVISAVFGCLPHYCTSWQLAYWGIWTYAPDYLPTGDELFQGGSFSNGGDYNVAKNNRLILATLQARTPAQFDHAMYVWQNWLAGQLPAVYEPDPPTLMETIGNLHIGVQDAALTITPEDWYYLK